MKKNFVDSRYVTSHAEETQGQLLSSSSHALLYSQGKLDIFSSFIVDSHTIKFVLLSCANKTKKTSRNELQVLVYQPDVQRLKKTKKNVATWTVKIIPRFDLHRKCVSGSSAVTNRRARPTDPRI